MSTVAAILAAGASTRFGEDKTLTPLNGKPVWKWSYDVYAAHPKVDKVIVIAGQGNLKAIQDVGATAFPGGDTRQESSRRALHAATGADILLIHDAARPFVTTELITAVIEAIERTGAAAAAIPVTDTIKQVGTEGITTLDRSTLVAMQTPQGASTDLLTKAHQAAKEAATDDMALIEALGIQPELVSGDPNNFKITSPEDLARAKAFAGDGEQRVGFGYDVHGFSSDPDRILMLGGISFENHPALDGHSDADVLLHAATDALLGAASLGDIGQHFPNTDPRWQGEPSLTFLKHASNLLSADGWSVVNLDMTLVAESPKIMKRSGEIIGAVASALGVDPGRVSVKATTNERLGFVGRGEGIAALATASIRRG